MKGEFLRVLVIRTEDAFVAQCLEHDISVQAADFDSLRARFETAVCVEADIHGGLSSIEPAPAEYQAMWNAALELAHPPENTEMRIAA